ncbi:calcium/sodium antiporter [Bacteroidia bacterium]|jgi:cation:H+ antiporter|nr:calcium/sodium antiporter [Bacteroidia bacterium]MDC1430928.1 calcium/sodium antiporter [Bacteroidia bacterium]
MLVYILFVVGFVLLIKGADWLVSGSASVAKKYNISDLVIGLTIVSMGTSMPELIVNILASTSGASEIAIGNVVGSNIANILLILGVAAFIYPLTIKESTVMSQIPFSIIAILLVAFAANAPIFNPDYSLMISQLDGVVFILFFALFMVYIIKLAREGRADMIEEAPDKVLPMGKSILFILLGMVGLFLGGKWVVDGAIKIAEQFGLSQNLIGLTIVAIGTSLPELVTSAMAAYRKNTDIAVANVIGSNIFNLLWVLGISAMISPMKYDPVVNADIIVLLVATCLIIFSLMTGRAKNQIGKPTGIFFLACYIAYTAFLIYRG